MKGNSKKIWLMFAAFILIGASGCAAKTQESLPVVNGAVEKEELPKINQLPLRDKDSLYALDEEDSVVTMYLTVSKGNEAEGTFHTWKEINEYSAYDYDAMGVNRFQVEGLLQVGDETGPLPGELGFGSVVPNSTIQIRGQTSSRNAQKNYKIRLKDSKGTWREQQTINLNKHQTDGTRFRNKLGFDLLKDFPQVMSLRTQFVHLYVKDETEGSGGFVDYGLYTQVEQLNKKGLRAHGLDPNAHLYKVNSCEFYRYEEEIKLADDPTFDEKAFEARLECKGDNDHSKLIRMLNAVNDHSITAEELLENYFNIENLTYWMAFQILLGNPDTQNRNFYIYSPQNLETWYIIPWDMDAMMRRTEDEVLQRTDGGAWEVGVSNYWGNVLFQKCLKSENFRAQLDAAIRDVKEYLSEERIKNLIDTYRPITEAYAFTLPDIRYQNLTKEEYDLVVKNLPELVDEYYQDYLSSLQKPLPFYIGVPVIEDNEIKIGWDVSYDFQAEDISYKAEIARDYAMQDILGTYEGVWPEMEMALPPPGQYFVRVQAKDSSGNEQYAFDYYVTEQGKEYGIKCFYVLPDGTIGEDIYEE